MLNEPVRTPGDGRVPRRDIHRAVSVLLQSRIEWRRNATHLRYVLRARSRKSVRSKQQVRSMGIGRRQNVANRAAQNPGWGPNRWQQRPRSRKRADCLYGGPQNRAAHGLRLTLSVPLGERVRQSVAIFAVGLCTQCAAQFPALLANTGLASRLPRVVAVGLFRNEDHYWRWFVTDA